AGRDRARAPARRRGRHTRRAAGCRDGRGRATARHAAARARGRQRRACMDRPDGRAGAHDAGAVAVKPARAAGWILLAALAASAGCVTRAPLTDTYSGPAALPEPLAERYALEIDEPPEAISDTLRERRDFVVREIVLPGRPASDDDEALETLTFEYYDVGGDETRPAIVVLPIANGNMLVSRYFARYF